MGRFLLLRLEILIAMVPLHLGLCPLSRSFLDANVPLFDVYSWYGFVVVLVQER